MGRIVINKTENKQTVILNDNADGVSGGYFDDAMVWHDLGGNAGPKYAYNIDDLYKVYGSIAPRTSSAPHEIMVFLDGYNRRRSFMTLNNEAVVGAMLNSSTKMCDDYNFRLIPVPEDAKKVTASISPSTQYVNLKLYTYEEGTGLTTGDDSGWIEGEYSTEFTPGSSQFISLSTKYDSAGTTYPAEPSNISIVFEKE